MTEKVKPIIKNIFWDVDGVLANLNFAYFNFLKNHKNYKIRKIPKIVFRGMSSGIDNIYGPRNVIQ